MDSSRYIEYWARQEWRHIEAHADIDELQARTTPTEWARLYLNIGTAVKGPTCVFPDVSSGGELLEQLENELVVAPAVAGRLLRFAGEALHAVPRPVDLWMLSFVKGAAEYEPEEMFGRSVILFNTWPDAPPKDVTIND